MGEINDLKQKQTSVRNPKKSQRFWWYQQSTVERIGGTDEA